jgi:hypothetical protein
VRQGQVLHQGNGGKTALFPEKPPVAKDALVAETKAENPGPQPGTESHRPEKEGAVVKVKGAATPPVPIHNRLADLVENIRVHLGIGMEKKENLARGQLRPCV